MKKIFVLTKIIFIYLLLTTNATTKESEFFAKGKEFFDNKKFEKSKILFERDIVFNPRSEKSYLYLAKIFYNRENDNEQEINLNSVLLLNPNNDEAIYMLTLLKIKQSDYNKAKELLDRFVLVCESFCNKKKEIQDKFDKLRPDDE
tara:strand:+ start:187 stop:624 length:438 start_codon:yes stop_codon:yes gene_type:complete